MSQVGIDGINPLCTLRGGLYGIIVFGIRKIAKASTFRN